MIIGEAHTHDDSSGFSWLANIGRSLIEHFFGSNLYEVKPKSHSQLEQLYREEGLTTTEAKIAYLATHLGIKIPSYTSPKVLAELENKYLQQ